jgi:hypothetical protein
MNLKTANRNTWMAHRVVPFLVAGSFLIGCESSQTTEPEPAGSEPDMAAPSEDPVEREQMQVRVEGADATREGDTITLDYPVLTEKNDILPDWAINPGIGGVLGAVGVAAPGVLGTKEQLNEARLNARTELAYMLEARFQSVGRNQLEQQVQATAGGLSDTSRKSFLGVDRTIADVVLAGSRQRALWFDPDNGECYVWVVLDGKVLEMVDHYIEQEISVFIANTPITTSFIPVRRRMEPPVVVIEGPEPPPPPPEAPKEPVEELEDRMKPIETVPLREGGEGGAP